MKKTHFLLLTILLSVQIFAQINISGDARVRARYDVTNDKINDSKTDAYYMYRARLKLSAEIGDGWYFKTMLGHYGYGAYGSTNGLSMPGKQPLTIEGANRPGLNFLEMYFGKDYENWGFSGGIIPIDGFNNPQFDIHYYPDIMVEVPFYLFANNGLFGFNSYFKFGDNKLNLLVLKDKNESYIEAANGTVKSDKFDTYTFGADYTLNIADFVVQPIFLFSLNPERGKNIYTHGFNITSPKFGDFTLHGSAIFSRRNSVPSMNFGDYADIYRIKLSTELGNGNLLIWYDYATKSEWYGTSKPMKLGEYKYNFIWAMYTVNIFESDKGTVTLSPTIRFRTEKSEYVDDASRKTDQSRFRAEVTAQITF